MPFSRILEIVASASNFAKRYVAIAYIKPIITGELSAFEIIYFQESVRRCPIDSN